MITLARSQRATERGYGMTSIDIAHRAARGRLVGSSLISHSLERHRHGRPGLLHHACRLYPVGEILTTSTGARAWWWRGRPFPSPKQTGRHWRID
eukprot:scaffold195670_cov23-Tisochrysis_lutea.AAC.1